MTPSPRAAVRPDEVGRLPPARRMTYEEFLAWVDDDTRAEWVDGEVIIMSPASIRQQRLLAFLFRLLGAFVEAADLGEVFTPPTQMKLPGSSGREPDILFVAREHGDRLLENRVDGPADLVVEIVSPDSRTRDLRDKLAEYEAGGVPEYWLIDPERRQARFLQLGPDGRYHEARSDERGVYESGVLRGLRLHVPWLWQEPLPKVRDVLGVAGVPATSGG